MTEFSHVQTQTAQLATALFEAVSNCVEERSLTLHKKKAQFDIASKRRSLKLRQKVQSPTTQFDTASKRRSLKLRQKAQSPTT